MNRSELRSRRRALRQALRERTRAAKAQLDAHPLVRSARRRRRLRTAAAVAVLSVLALLSRCACATPPPPPEPVVEAPAPTPTPPPKPAPKPKRKPLQGKTEKTDRGAYPGEPRAQASWVDDYRLQVAARSSRLSACFTGIDKPGAIRWTASLNPERGTVSDHDLEALAASSPIWKKERECLIQALSNPPYKLPAEAAEAEGLPKRMSIVIEF